MSRSPKSLSEAFEMVSASPVTLSERLAAYGEWLKRFKPDISGDYDRLVDRLTQAKAGNAGPKDGTIMPSFLLPDQEGRLVGLDELLPDGPVIISFNRGHWCSFCRLELLALADMHDELLRLGARVLSIVPVGQKYSKRLKERYALPFDLLTDVDGGYALSLGLLIDIGTDLKTSLESAGVELSRYNSGGNWFLPIPATYVVGRDGRILASHVDPNFRKRMAVDQIIQATKSGAAM